MHYDAIDPELVCVAQYLPPHRRRVALDIGANNGVTSSVLARVFDQVHAFEPNLDLLTEWSHVAPNNVKVWPYALSNRDGEATLHVPVIGKLTLPGWASLGTPALQAAHHMYSMTVTCQRLDSLRVAQSAVDFVKIDVEGHELPVLEGAKGCILRWRPWLIVEVWDRNRGAVLQLLEHWNYEPFHFLTALGREVNSQNLMFKPKGP